MTPPSAPQRPGASAADSPEQYVRTPEILALIRRVMRWLLIVSAAGAVIASVVGVAIGGAAGLWAALMAAALSLFFTATTVAALWYAAGRGQQVLMVVLLGGWLVKMIILGLVIFWLKDQTFYHRGVFAGTIITLVVAALVVEMALVATAKIPYVDVTSATDSEGPERGVDGSAAAGQAASAPEAGPGPAPAAPAAPQEQAEGSGPARDMPVTGQAPADGEGREA